MLDRPRAVVLGWAALCFGLVALLAVAVDQGWGAVTSVDDRGKPAEAWSVDQGWLRHPLRWVEVGFQSIPIIVVTLVVVVLLLLRGYRRAAVFSAGVVAAALVAYPILKGLIGRDRPPWQNPAQLAQTQSFPSGHATSVAALGGVLIVLVAIFVRRANARRAAYAGIVLVVLLVGADRVLLGRHYPSDVIGGYLLGTGLVLLGIALYNPRPRSHAAAVEPLPEIYSSERNLAVVLNPIKVEDVGQFESLVTAMALESGWSTPTWHYTTVEDPGTGMAEAAAVEGADLVLVCGGDGTVREVCAELAGTGIPVGIVPAGTGNLLARNLDIPLYIRAAIDVALTGQDRAVDMVEVSGDGFEDTHFMVMAGMGFDAAIMEGVNEDIKKRVGWLAYVLSALKSLMFPAVRVEISVDDGEFTKHRARTIVVGNVGFLQAGMPLLPDAAIDDGLLDVVILHPRNLLSWIPLAWRVLLKRPHTDELVNRMIGRSVVIRASTDTPRQLDGDSIGPGKELRMTCVQGRLLVRVPR
ncbi:MAG: YegS/Rv2252/BmrU family lipid kinase [Nocardioides sp.]|nr:YegS/Rv2252/BmrU family lipid kinase [Nocardioidaceae bacterium]MCB8955517.1 YegS/Rv2252/BmrU family lipid kinase [Nocardioides sp.]